jgi:hypothetical protein
MDFGFYTDQLFVLKIKQSYDGIPTEKINVIFDHLSHSSLLLIYTFNGLLLTKSR